MRHPVLAALVALMLNTVSGPAIAAEDPEYKPAGEFLKIPEGWNLGPCSATDITRQGEIYLLHRGKHPVICFDASGKYLRSWGDDLLTTPHGLRVDRQGNVWVTDIGNHRVFKFDSTGKLLLALGTGKPGAELDQFNKPTDVAFGPDGEFYVSDGYVNTRVLKYSAEGKLIKTWGMPGTGPGEFDLPHAIIVDPKGRVLVADRSNNRIQIFDREGQHQQSWTGFAPYGLAFRADGALFVATGVDQDIIQLDAAGKIVRHIGREGKGPGEFGLPHMLAFDATGNLYVAEVDGKRLQKFTRK